MNTVALLPGRLISASLLLFTITSCQVGKPLVYGTKPLFVPLANRLEKDLKDQPIANRFTGEPNLVQIGAIEFYFEQSKTKPFSFTSHLVTRDGRPWKITPQSMLTTGSSTPRLLWSVKNFGNFDFTKAAVIHDWLFEAHHRWCLAFHDRNEPLLRELQDYADPELNKQLIKEKHPGASAHTLSIEEAANIMAECIDWEMRQCEHFATTLKAELKADDDLPVGHKNKMPAGERRGIEAILSDFTEVQRSRITLAQYHWSIRSFVAKKFWNSGGNGSTPTHTSTDRTIALLKKRGLLATAVNNGYLSSDLVERISKSSSKVEVYHLLELKVEKMFANEQELHRGVEPKELGALVKQEAAAQQQVY